MKTTYLLSAALLATAASLAAPSAYAQSHPEFVPLGRASGAYYKPDSGPAPHVAYLVSHRTGNNLNTLACKEFAKRGIACLGWNTRFQNNEMAVRWEDIAFDVKSAIDWVRTQPGITKVVLLGHSGGSPLMTYYQAVAEAGPSWCTGANKLVKCEGGARMTGWKPADGLLLADAHPGNGVNTLRDMNPALTYDGDKVIVDAALDPFNPANGYNPKGQSHYSAEFRARYAAAQSKKMNEWIAKAQAMQADMKAGKGMFPDDDVFLAPGTDQAGAAILNAMDPSIPETMSSMRPERLLKNDGTIVTQVVRSVQMPEPEQKASNLLFDGGTKYLTTKSFLSANSIRSTNANDGVDYCSSNNSTTCAVQSIKVPTLILAMGAFHFIRDQEIMYDLSGAKDKEYMVLEGAVHGYTPCKECEKTPGQYGNSVKNMFDYVAKWTNSRF